MTLTDKLLYFWFGTNNLTKSVEKREVWFKATPEFDKAIADNFLNAYEKAAANELDYLCNDQSGCLTLIVLLDQVPRNLFRNSGKAYATDQKARSIAYDAIRKGYDKNASLWHKVFFYLPLQHSEGITDQHRSVELFTKLNIKSAREAAIGHQEVIEKFEVGPDQVVEVMGLMGDPSDHIPGVTGVGPKTAAELIQKFGSIKSLYERIDEVEKEKVKEKLEGLRQIKRWEGLNKD